MTYSVPYISFNSRKTHWVSFLEGWIQSKIFCFESPHSLTPLCNSEKERIFSMQGDKQAQAAFGSQCRKADKI